MDGKLWAAILFLAANMNAAETRGVVTNVCTPPPIGFAFAQLPDSCEVGQCPAAAEYDVTLEAGSFLKSTGGLWDLGPLKSSLNDLSLTLPPAGFKDSLPFHPKRIYGVKLKAGGYALLAETREFIGGCLHWEFRWRYNDSTNVFKGTNAAINMSMKPAPSGAQGRRYYRPDGKRIFRRPSDAAVGVGEIPAAPRNR